MDTKVESDSHNQLDLFKDPVPEVQRPSKYHRCIRGMWVDVYDILAAYQTDSAAIDHAIKKLLAPGSRSGGKSRVQDIEEAIWSLQRALEKERE